MTNASSAAACLERADVRGWLVSDYCGSNPVFAQLLGRRLFLTRRAFALITADAPRTLVSRVDATEQLTALDGWVVDTYASWAELHSWLATHVGPLDVVAMEYSPRGQLPAMSRVDGGTLDLVRDLGVEVRSSAELFQLAVAPWSEANLRSHRVAMSHAVQIKDLAFDHVVQRLRAGERCSEHAVQEFILAEVQRRHLVTNDPPVVSVNAHSGDPHYVPSAEHSAEVRPGDWLLIDLWCKEPGDAAVFADITWVAYAGPRVPAEHQKIFDVVAGARDAVIDLLRERVTAPTPVSGYELDDAAREHITQAGYGEYFVHRTGHSLGPGETVHGLGANLDNLETHDTRPILPGLGFTIEPGIYLPAFGVRSEINVFMTASGPDITSPVQSAPVVMDL